MNPYRYGRGLGNIVYDNNSNPVRTDFSSSGAPDLVGGGKGLDKIPKGFKLAKEFGYKHGQKVYKYGNKYFSRDIGSGNGRGSHNGGVWKVFEQRNGQLHRIGTADKNLNIFKR